MNIKKLIGAAAAASIAAASLFAVSASAAETTNIDLEYVNASSGTAIGSVTYDKSTNLSYSLTVKSSNELAKAKAGDTVTITYKVSAEGNDKNRAGFKIADTQFYVNSSGTTGINPNFLTSNACHLNTQLEKDKPATITYEFKLGDNGQPTQITEAKIADAYGSTKSYKNASKTSLPQPLSVNASLESLTLNTGERKGVTDSHPITLSDFKAVLTTTADTPAEVGDVTAVSGENGSDIFSGDDGWYAKAFQFNVTPGTNTVKKINVTAGEKSESREVSLTGEGTSYVYGIIVGANNTDALNGITPTVTVEE